MQVNTYGFKLSNKEKRYMNPNGKSGWTDDYRLVKPFDFNISVTGKLTGHFHTFILDWSETISKYSNVLSKIELDKKLEQTEIFGLDPINILDITEKNIPFAKYNSSNNSLTFLNMFSDDLDGVTLGYDTYWKISNSNWPWEAVKSDIKQIIFLDPIHLDFSDNLSGIFSNMTSLETIKDIGYLVTTGVVNLSNMFYNCSKLKTLNLSSFDTSKVTNMNSMFEGCSNLENLNIYTFSYQNITSGTSMFKGCTKLKTNIIIDDTRLNFANSNFANMFQNCATQPGSYVFLHYSPDTNLSVSDITSIGEYLNTTYPSSILTMSGYHNVVGPIYKRMNLNLKSLLDAQNKISIKILFGEEIQIRNNTIPLYFLQGKLLQSDKQLLSGRIKNSNVRLHISQEPSDVYGAWFSDSYVDTELSKSETIEIELGDE